MKISGSEYKVLGFWARDTWLGDMRVVGIFGKMNIWTEGTACIVYLGPE